MRSKRPRSLPNSAPTMVPKATHIATTKTMATQRRALEGAGGPIKTAAAQSVEKAKGQISLGRTRPVAPVHTTVANATSALSGKMRTTEKSTLDC